MREVIRLDDQDIRRAIIESLRAQGVEPDDWSDSVTIFGEMNGQTVKMKYCTAYADVKVAFPSEPKKTDEAKGDAPAMDAVDFGDRQLPIPEGWERVGHHGTIQSGDRIAIVRNGDEFLFRDALPDEFGDSSNGLFGVIRQRAGG